MSEIANYAAAVLGSISIALWLLAAALQVYFNDPKSEYTDSQARQAGFGRCDKAPMLDSIIQYDFDEDKYSVSEKHKDVKMCVMDGSSYRAELYTRPDFLCSEYSPK